jgi:hypothetical protein
MLATHTASRMLKATEREVPTEPLGSKTAVVTGEDAKLHDEERSQ